MPLGSASIGAFLGDFLGDIMCTWWSGTAVLRWGPRAQEICDCTVTIAHCLLHLAMMGTSTSDLAKEFVCACATFGEALLRHLMLDVLITSDQHGLGHVVPCGILSCVHLFRPNGAHINWEFQCESEIGETPDILTPTELETFTTEVGLCKELYTPT